MTIRKYNPGFLSTEDLVATFCVRMAEYESLVEALRECSGRSNTHQIVIGPRGSGKTSLLLRVVAEMQRDADLAARFFPIVFAEESYEVSTAGEFWLECISRLAGQVSNWDGDIDFHRTFEDLRVIHDDQTLEDRCLGVLQDFADRERKRLVLIVENLNMLFSDMGDNNAGWRMRKTLQTEPRIVLLASATSRFAQLDDPKEALYELFRVIRLDPLDTEGCASLWRTVSGHERAPQTVQALRILTGGNPRLLTIVARFGVNLSFRELMADILDMVDDHTEYFKSHLDALPAQERRVYLALADLWRPASAREIADRARLGTSKCSAQLARLVDRGAVEVHGGSPRRKLYYLTERLYNIYYLMRRARGPVAVIDALIRFMESYYSTEELNEFGARMAREASALDGGALPIFRMAFDQLVGLPSLEAHREDLLSLATPHLAPAPGEPAAELQASSDTIELSRKALALTEHDQPEEAMAVWKEVTRRCNQSRAPELEALLAKALVGTATALNSLNRHREALTACDEVLKRFGKKRDLSGLHRDVATAMFVRGEALMALNRSDEAIDAWGAVAERFGKDDFHEVVELVVAAHANVGITLFRSGRLEEAVTAFEEAAKSIAANKLTILSTRLLMLEALCHVGRGRALVALERDADALRSWEQAIMIFEANDLSDNAELFCSALMNKATTLHRVDRLEAALELWGDVVKRFGNDDRRPGLLAMVADAQTTRCAVLERLGRYEEALIVWQEVEDRFKNRDEREWIELVAKSLVHRSADLFKLDRTAEGFAVWQEAVRRFGNSDVQALRDLEEWTLCKWAQHKLTEGRARDAIEFLDHVLLQERAGLPNTRLQGHLVRARAWLAEGDCEACARDIETALSILPELDKLPREVLVDLADLSAGIGLERMSDLIGSSPASDLLLPLRTALERELGLEPRVAREVEEIAEDIRRDLLARPDGKARQLAP